MINLIDVHTHTISSGHAYSTLEENISEAKKKEMRILGYSEHGPQMPGGPHIFHISNLTVLPRYYDELLLLRGCEANIIDYNGTIDIPRRISKKLDYMIASLHDVCIKDGGIEKNTAAILGAMDNEDVTIIGHPGNPAFPVDYEKVILKAKEKNIIIEINNSSFHGSRKGSYPNCKEIAKLCNINDVNIIIGSDSHVSKQIGGYKIALEMLEGIGFNQELILNDKVDKFINILKSKGKLLDIEIK